MNSNKVSIRRNYLSKLKSFLSLFLSRKNFSSSNYWEKRYIERGNSGEGSYGDFAEFKSRIINDFVKRNNIQRALEFGCGDGNQIKTLNIPEYIGLDVSKTSIGMCSSLFGADEKKSFFLYSPDSFCDGLKVFHSDLTMSLDVIYHLVEDNVFDKYMTDLFDSSRKWVIIYSSNTDEKVKLQARHVKHRKFSKWIEENKKSWKLYNKIENEVESGEFVAHFYIYKKEK